MYQKGEWEVHTLGREWLERLNGRMMIIAFMAKKVSPYISITL